MVEENGEAYAPVGATEDTTILPLSNGRTEYAEAGDPLDEGRSSSLSELEDVAEEVEMVPAISAVSKHIEADSEAETERLEISPKKEPKHKDTEIGNAPFIPSPSKLAQSAVPPVLEQEEFSDSAVSSPGPSEEELDSDLPSVHSVGSENEEDTDANIGEISPRKRKHSDMEDDSESNDEAEEDRRRKRRTESIRSDVEERSEAGLSREPTVEPTDEIRDDQDILGETAGVLQNTQNTLKSRALKPPKGRNGEVKAREPLKHILEEAEDPDKAIEPGPDDVRPESDEEDRHDGEEEDVEAAARDEEEYAKKMAAMDSLAALEKHFAALRDRLYDERIVALNEEMAQLSTSRPSHPEYLRQIECIRKHRDEKFDIEQKLLVYKVKSLKTTSVAQRSQIHSGYFQTVRDVREKHLDQLGERSSRLRRDHIKIPNYTIPFPTRRSTQVTQQTSYNREVSILSGVARYVGFPAAPNITPALQSEVDEDLGRMGISLHPLSSHKAAQPKLTRSTFPSAMSRPAAEEQFLEQNPWANPQHPIHQRHLGRLSRQVSDQTPAVDTTATPANQKSSGDPNRPAGSASTIPEQLSAQASSALATPSGNPESLQPLADLTATSTAHRYPSTDDKPQPQKDRLQSVSPTETRKHNLAMYDPGPIRPPPSGVTVTNGEDGLSQPFRPSRIALFGPAGRRSSLPPNGPSVGDLDAHSATSSPLTLHQHARENRLTPAAGLSRIGAR